MFANYYPVLIRLKLFLIFGVGICNMCYYLSRCILKMDHHCPWLGLLSEGNNITVFDLCTGSITVLVFQTTNFLYCFYSILFCCVCGCQSLALMHS